MSGVLSNVKLSPINQVPPSNSSQSRRMPDEERARPGRVLVQPVSLALSLPGSCSNLAVTTNPLPVVQRSFSSRMKRRALATRSVMLSNDKNMAALMLDNDSTSAQRQPSIAQSPKSYRVSVAASLIPASAHELDQLYKQLATSQAKIALLETQLAEEIALRTQAVHDLNTVQAEMSELQNKHELLQKTGATTDHLGDVKTGTLTALRHKTKLSLPDLTTIIASSSDIPPRPELKRATSETSATSSRKLMNSFSDLNKAARHPKEKHLLLATPPHSSSPSGRISHCIPHRFVSAQLVTLSKECQVCHSTVWNRDGVKCQDCKYVAHATCALHAPPDCNMKLLDDALMASISNASGAALSHHIMLPSSIIPTLKREESSSSLTGTGLVQARNQVFGVDLDALLQDDNEGIPSFLSNCLGAIEKRGLDELGLYRVPGLKTDVDKLQVYFSYGKPNLEEYYVHSIASLLKRFFRELPDPVCTHQQYRAFLNAVSQDKPVEVKVMLLHDVVHQLSVMHYNTLRRIIAHLTRVTEHSATNKMTAASLGVVFGPTLIRDRDDRPNDIGGQVAVVELLIKHYDSIFAVAITPPEQQNDADPVGRDMFGLVHMRQSSESLSSRIAKSLYAETPSICSIHHPMNPAKNMRTPPRSIV